MTRVFVPQDLEYMQVTVDNLYRVSPKLVPLIAHDRAGFGGGVCCGGITMLFCVWCGEPSRSLWQVLTLAGGVGFSTAIVIRPVIGCTDFIHLAPAYLGAIAFTTGTFLSYRPMVKRDAVDAQSQAALNRPHAV